MNRKIKNNREITNDKLMINADEELINSRSCRKCYELIFKQQIGRGE